MIDIGFSKLALIGVVALIVVGPEKLPRVARTVGALLGKAQRYVADVKAEVNRSMDLEELRKMKDSMESAARDVNQSIHQAAGDFERDLQGDLSHMTRMDDDAFLDAVDDATRIVPAYKHPGKNWRVKRSNTPHWYKTKAGVRRQALSGAARVARFRPRSQSQR
jgi:sec-independent protein translocase protein TatB